MFCLHVNEPVQQKCMKICPTLSIPSRLAKKLQTRYNHQQNMVFHQCKSLLWQQCRLLQQT